MVNHGSAVVAHHFICSASAPRTDTLVLLHGWGTSSTCWQPLIPELQKIADVIALDLPGFGDSKPLVEFTLDAVIDVIAEQLPTRAIIIGWSLGGMLAVQLAARYPAIISRIITLATNNKFVANNDYETAMPLSINCQFNNGFASDAIATLKLFGKLLAQGDINERTLFKQVRALVEPEKINANWLQALQLLAVLDNREAFAQLAQPGLHLLAEHDALVPASAMQLLAAANRHQQIQLISNAAHALHWSQPILVAQRIKDFLLDITPSLIDKKQVAQSFGRAAYSYDSVADLQRTAGKKLLQSLSIDVRADTVLDLGCGTGYFSHALSEKFPAANIIAADIAEGMLQFSRKQPSSAYTAWLCSDAENLALADNSIDVIFSNFALQWCVNLPQLFAELHRVLKPDGQLIFSSLGPQTLHELKMAWQQVDDFVHVNQFYEQEFLQEVLISQGFILSGFERSASVLEFEKLTDLTRSLKSLGAHNMNQGRAQGLSGRKKLEAFKAAYEQYRRNNLLPATYDVYYISAKK